MNHLPSVATFEGEVLSEAVLDARAMCSSHTEGPMCDIARHLEQVRIFSRNFCWAHRHLGASYGVVGERAGMDDEVIV